MQSLASAFIGKASGKHDDTKSPIRVVPKSSLTNQQAKKILRRSLTKFLRLRYYKSHKHTNYLRVQILNRIIDTIDNVHIINIAIATSIDDNNTNLCILACKSLEQVLSTDSSRDKEVASALLVEAAYAFKDNHLVVLHVANCISDLCTSATLTVDKATIDTTIINPISENLQKVNELFDNSVCEILSEVCEIHLTNTSCIYAITKAIQRLTESHTQSRHLLGSEVACLSLKKACDEHRNNPQIQDNILKTIITVCNNSQESQNHMGSQGLCTSVLLTMSENRADENVIKVGCKCIISLCANNHKQNQIRLSSDDNPTILCQIILNYIRKPKIFEQLSWSILTLITTSRDNSNAFNDSGLSDILSKIISNEVQCHEKVIIQSTLMLSYIIDELNTNQLEKNKEMLNFVKQLELTSSNEVKKAAKFCLTRAFPISYENMNNDDS